MRVFVITQDEPVYAPRYLARIHEKISPRHEIIGVTALSPAAAGWPSVIRQKLGVYGPVDFVRAGMLFLRSKLSGRTVARFTDEHRIPRVAAARINSPAYIHDLTALAPDVLLSVAAPSRFGPELIAVPRVACLNVHSSLLPKYRGLDGLFWAMAHGESNAGVSVHTMVDRFDAGGIVEQESFPIAASDTLHDLYGKAIELGSTLIARALDRYETGAVSARSIDSTTGSYFSWPDAEAVSRFRSLGRRFF